MTSWHALVVEGPAPAVRAFVTGFFAGRGEHGGAIFGGDIVLEHGRESLGARLRALFTAGTHEVVLVPAELASPLAEAVREHGSTVGVRLVDRHVVTAASAGFRVKVFARELAQDIRTDLL